MRYITNQDGVNNYFMNKDGEASFALNGTKYYAVGQPFINQGGSPVEVYYEQALYTEDTDGYNSPILAGRLKFSLIEWTNENDPNGYYGEDESIACDWDKFEVYLHD